MTKSCHCYILSAWKLFSKQSLMKAWEFVSEYEKDFQIQKIYLNNTIKSISQTVTTSSGLISDFVHMLLYYSENRTW